MLTYMKKGRGTHKFIAFWEIKNETVNSVCEKAEELMIRIREEPENYPWALFGPYCMEGETKGFQIFETDNQEKMDKLKKFWGSDVDLSYHPIKETRIWEITDPSRSLKSVISN